MVAENCNGKFLKSFGVLELRYLPTYLEVAFIVAKDLVAS